MCSLAATISDFPCLNSCRVIIIQVKGVTIVATMKKRPDMLILLVMLTAVGVLLTELLIGTGILMG